MRVVKTGLNVPLLVIFIVIDNIKPKGHEPVLLKEILALAPISPPGQGKKMLDTTFGCGGHTKAFLEHFPKLSIIALDRDIQAIQWGQAHILPFLSQETALKLYHSSFHPFPALINKNLFPKGPFFDIILLDLGVSSLQLDKAERGFSFYKDGPLDMRMDQNQTLRAKDIINQFSEQELNNIFFHYEERLKEQNLDTNPTANTTGSFSLTPQPPLSGGNKKSKDRYLENHKINQKLPLKLERPVWKKHKSNKVVQAIVRERKKKPIESTKELADLIVKQTGWRKKGRHPATVYFLALRLKVNEELISLEQGLPEMIKSLKPQGRLFVLTFHSAEDRIVKLAFKKAKEDKEGQAFKKVIFPSREEIKQNPRARSAKLRVFEKAYTDLV